MGYLLHSPFIKFLLRSRSALSLLRSAKAAPASLLLAGVPSPSLSCCDIGNDGHLLTLLCVCNLSSICSLLILLLKLIIQLSIIVDNTCTLKSIQPVVDPCVSECGATAHKRHTCTGGTGG